MKKTKLVRRRDGIIQRYHLSIKPLPPPKKQPKRIKYAPYQIPVNVLAVKPKLIYKDPFGNKLFANYLVSQENVRFVAKNARGQRVDEKSTQLMLSRAKMARRLRDKKRRST